jgi:glycosyltransferase involved in cell wall biosynthesis
MKISVILPVRNKGPHLNRAIDSILVQTYSNFELLIVDDNSSDNSMEIIQSYVDHRIQVFHRTEPGPGGYAARNMAIEQSSCEWVAFLDADDAWEPGHLEQSVEAINTQPDAAIIAGGWSSIYKGVSSQHQYQVKNQHKGLHKVTLNDYLVSLLAGVRVCCTPVVVANRKKLMSVGMFPDKRTKKGGDLYLWIRLLSKFPFYSSPHKAALVYRDSVNMVTGSNLFEPSLFQSLIKEVDEYQSEETVRLLTRYVNKLLLKDYLTGIKRNGKKYFNLREVCTPSDFKEQVKHAVIHFCPVMLFKLALKLRK